MEENLCLYNIPHNLSLNNKFNHNINDFLKHFHAMPTKGEMKGNLPH